MELGITEDQSMLLDMFSRFFSNESTMVRVREAEPVGFDTDMWKQLVELGAASIRVSELQGGLEASLRDVVLIANAAGKSLASVPFIDCTVTTGLLSKIGTPLALEWLQKMISGSAIVTLALTENDQQIISSGAIADAVIFLDGNALKLIEFETDKLEYIENLGSLPLAKINFSDHEAAILSDSEGAVEGYRSAVEEWKILTAAQLSGICESSLGYAAEYADEREAFGVKIGTFQGLSHPLAECATGLEGLKALLDYSIWAIEFNKDDAGALISMAYWWATQVTTETMPKCIHVFGGYGVSEEHDIQLFARRGMALVSVLGDRQQALLSVANRLWGDEKVALPNAGITGLDFDLGAPAAAMTKKVNDFFQQNLTPDLKEKRHHSWDGYVPEIYKKLAAENLLFPHWPKEYGGLDATPAERYALQKAFYDERWTIFPQTTSRIIGEMILEFGSDKLKADVLPEIILGDAICCIGLTEPHCGSDVFAAKTRAIRKGDRWIINGQKMFTSGANIGKYVMLLTNTDPSLPKHVGKTLFLVPLDHPGVEIHRVDTISADRTNITYYTDVDISDDYRLGDVNSGSGAMGYMLSLEQEGSPYGFEFGHLISQAADWAKNTASQGGVVFDDPLARYRLAMAAVEHKVAETLYLRMVHNSEKGKEVRHHSSMLKAFVTESWKKNSAELISMAAPFSLLSNTPDLSYLEEGWRSSLAACIYGGSTQVHLSVTAEKQLGLPRSR